MATVTHAGGIAHLRRIADPAALHQLRAGGHGAADLSPVCMAVALHFDTWVPNSGIQEYMRHTQKTDAVFPHDYTFSDGELIVGEAPGHGVDIGERLAARSLGGGVRPAEFRALLDEGQFEFETRTCTQFAENDDLTAMQVQYPLDDCKSESAGVHG